KDAVVLVFDYMFKLLIIGNSSVGKKTYSLDNAQVILVGNK
uniref:O-RAB3 small GTP-binding protein (Fragments) n=1 Tax=Torpedo marmorata TaxID=7788 RepID=Q9PSQ3_TORMA